LGLKLLYDFKSERELELFIRENPLGIPIARAYFSPVLSNHNAYYLGTFWVFADLIH
jgi:hypothetical protein